MTVPLTSASTYMVTCMYMHDINFMHVHIHKLNGHTKILTCMQHACSCMYAVVNESTCVYVGMPNTVLVCGGSPRELKTYQTLTLDSRLASGTCT